MDVRMVWSMLMFAAFLNLLVSGQLSNLIDESPDIIRDSSTVTKKWEKLESGLKSLVNGVMKAVLPSLMDEAQSLNISSTCITDTMRVVTGIRSLKPWAVRFLDSTAKSFDGVLTGRDVAYGVYDECLDTIAINQRSGKQKGKVMFTGKYCTLNVRPYLPPMNRDFKEGEIMDELKDVYKRGTVLSEIAKYTPVLYYVSFRLGLCIPSGCSADDLNNVFSNVSDYLGLYMKVKRCEVKEETKYTTIMITVMSIYSFAGFIVLLGTLTDIYCYYISKKPKSQVIHLLLAFSVISNFQKLVDTSTSSKTLSCLNGIRFITMSWVIMGHTYLLLVFKGIFGLFYANEKAKADFAVQVIANSTVAVDTFFFLGGFLVCYLATKHVVVSKRNFSIKLFILHRLWRILPVYTFAVLFMFIIELVSSGPIAHDFINPFVVGCQENWWASLLFINNFYHPDDACIPHAWYLSLDMQFYICSLIILIPLFRWPKVGISIAIASLVCFTVATAVVVHVNSYPPTFLLSTQNVHESAGIMTAFYFKPYPHAGPYIVGILVGYFLALHPDIKISKSTQLFGWCCAIVVSTTILYGPYGWHQRGEAMPLETIFYASCHRVAWAMCIAWMLVCCATGYGGVVNYILSWKVWVPLGRLSFTAYIAHFLVQISFMAMARSLLPPYHFIAVWIYFGHLMVTYGVAFVATMLIESPSIALEKLLIPQRSTRTLNSREKGRCQTLDVVNGVAKSESQMGVENVGFTCADFSNSSSKL